MIPQPWVAFVLMLGAFRVTRLLAWDDFPPVLRARNWATGMQVAVPRSVNSAMGLTGEPVEERILYKRPTTAKLLSCAYCAGFWVSLVVYAAWRWGDETWTTTVMAPFALSAAIGMAARWLDP